ncbi:hypothetical protein B0H13DRAFT_1851928 [Mycena leptocephala]|nr:hypothetical protein B0H13DRAFT_1851928 [Mycena leptocephala]
MGQTSPYQSKHLQLNVLKGVCIANTEISSNLVISDPDEVAIKPRGLTIFLYIFTGRYPQNTRTVTTNWDAEDAAGVRPYTALYVFTSCAVNEYNEVVPAAEVFDYNDPKFSLGGGCTPEPYQRRAVPPSSKLVLRSAGARCCHMRSGLRGGNHMRREVGGALQHWELGDAGSTALGCAAVHARKRPSHIRRHCVARRAGVAGVWVASEAEVDAAARGGHTTLFHCRELVFSSKKLVALR